MAERHDEKSVDRDADHDRRDAVQHVGGIAHRERDAAAVVLREIDAAEKADRHPHDGGDEQQLGAADERVGHPAPGLADRRREVREEVERQRRRPLPDEVPERV